MAEGKLMVIVRGVHKADQRIVSAGRQVIEFHGEGIGQIIRGGHAGIDHGVISCGQTKCRVALNGINDALAGIQIPMRWELAILIGSEIVGEDDGISGFEIVVLVRCNRLRRANGHSDYRWCSGSAGVTAIGRRIFRAVTKNRVHCITGSLAGLIVDFIPCGILHGILDITQSATARKKNGKRD